MIHARHLALALALGTISPFALRPVLAAPPIILSSSAASNQLTINGSNFLPGTASVLLGEYGPLTIVTQTATRLVVNLPAAIAPGSYNLSVRIGGKANFDESVVMIGGPKWVSLGYLGAPTLAPRVIDCDQRFINHNTAPPGIFMPTAKTFNSNTDMTFYFATDLLALNRLIENPTLQRIIPFYNESPEPKALSATISRVNETYWSVSVLALYIDENGTQGNGFGVPQAQVAKYEIQESCQ